MQNRLMNNPRRRPQSARTSLLIVAGIVLLALIFALPALGAATAQPQLAPAATPAVSEIGKYLVIAMGDDGDVGRAFQMSNSEIGADRKVLSVANDSGCVTDGGFPNLVDVFGTRWNTTTDPDSLNDASTVFQSIDWSGEVALTSNNGAFDSSNSLVWADTGIQSVLSNPLASVSNTKYMDVGNSSCAGANIAIGAGVTTGNSYASLLSELGAWKTYIAGLSNDATINSNSPFQNNQASNGAGGLRTNYTDSNADGVVVVDVNPGGDFDLNNLDWVIDSTDGKLVIFRLLSGSNMVMNNVSIVLGNGGIADNGLGAIFVSQNDGGGSGDTVFNVGSNLVLNGIGFWDLNVVGEGGSTKTNININNAQGCAQFISQKVNFQNNRWNRCALTPSTPTPTPTNTPTATPTDTPTGVPTNTPTATPTDTPTATPTDTPTATPTDTPTATPTSTPSLPATIGDFVWEDLNGDGVQDNGEPGIADVNVKLFNLADVEIGSTQTNANGLYSFTVPAGNYYLTFQTPPGYVFSPQDVDDGNANPDERDSDPNVNTGRTANFSVTASQTDNTWDAGLYRPANIGNYVWYDANADGVQNVGEPGIANVTLALYEDSDGTPGPSVGDTFIAQTATGANGNYLFANLPPGDYYVDVSDLFNVLTGFLHTVGPQSVTDPSPVVTLQSGSNRDDIDFGYYRPLQAGYALVGDTVFYDGNLDGIQNGGEPGIPGVTVIVLDAGNLPIGTATTNTNGKYFIAVPIGSGYKIVPVQSTVPPGLLPTTLQLILLPNLVSGQQYLDADFGYGDPSGSLLGRIDGVVFQDVFNNDPLLINGIYEPITDTVFAGVTIDLIRDDDNNGVQNGSEPVIATVTNLLPDANNNNFSFGGLPAGNYLVRVTDTNNVLDTFEVILGPNQNADNHSKQQPYQVNLPAGGVELRADFGYYRAGGGGSSSGAIGNTVWHDVNGDGLFAPLGELGISGVSVDLWDDVDGDGVLNPITDTLRDMTFTDGFGDYYFFALPNGDYLVQVTDMFGVLAGYIPTALGPTPGADLNNQAQPYAISIVAQETNLTADFGYALPATIGDFIFFDNNGNGVQDPSETIGIDGIQVTVTHSSGQVYTTPPSVGGVYSFTNLIPGNYTVTVPPTAAGVALTSASPYVTFVPSGGSDLNADFGYISPTGVNIVSFTALAEAEGVRLRWQTSLEEDLDGFVVLRSTRADGMYKPVSDLIPAANDPLGASYEWLDAGADAASLFWYKLQAQPDGDVIGPIPSREDPGVGGNNRVYIPMIVR